MMFCVIINLLITNTPSDPANSFFIKQLLSFHKTYVSSVLMIVFSDGRNFLMYIMYVVYKIITDLSVYIEYYN